MHCALNEYPEKRNGRKKRRENFWTIKKIFSSKRNKIFFPMWIESCNLYFRLSIFIFWFMYFLWFSERRRYCTMKRRFQYLTFFNALKQGWRQILEVWVMMIEGFWLPCELWIFFLFLYIFILLNFCLSNFLSLYFLIPLYL